MTSDLGAAAYPLFSRPDAYQRKRCASSFRSRIQQWSERRALRELLRDAERVRSVCDLPCGIGRSFSLWGELGLTVLGVDLSAPMALRAEQERTRLALPGRIELGDAFEEREREHEERADLVACLRFAYYFSPEQRHRLLAALHSRTRRYLLLQQRVADGLLGRWKSARAHVRQQRRRTRAKHAGAWSELRPELEDAGWKLLRMRRQSPLSDRVLILAERA